MEVSKRVIISDKELKEAIIIYLSSKDVIYEADEFWFKIDSTSDIGSIDSVEIVGK